MLLTFCSISFFPCQGVKDSSALSSPSDSMYLPLCFDFDPLKLSFLLFSRCGSMWILIKPSIMFDQHCLLKILSFIQVCISEFFIKNHVSMSVWTCIYIFKLNSIDQHVHFYVVFIIIVILIWSKLIFLIWA